MTKYNDLIFDLSNRLNRKLKPDKNNCVTLLIEQKVTVQIETDRNEEFLIIGAFIAELPPGKFREHILRDALKANSLYKNTSQVLSYMKNENHLIIHKKMLLEAISSDNLFKEIKNISSRAKKWLESLDNGRSCPDDEMPAKTTSSDKSIFQI